MSATTSEVAKVFMSATMSDVAKVFMSATTSVVARIAMSATASAVPSLPISVALPATAPTSAFIISNNIYIRSVPAVVVNPEVPASVVMSRNSCQSIHISYI